MKELFNKQLFAVYKKMIREYSKATKSTVEETANLLRPGILETIMERASRELREAEKTIVPKKRQEKGQK